MGIIKKESGVTVSDCRMLVDPSNRKAIGCAKVKLASEEDALKVLETLQVHNIYFFLFFYGKEKPRRYWHFFTGFFPSSFFNFNVVWPGPGVAREEHPR